MKSLFKFAVLVALAVVVAMPLSGAENEKKEKAKKEGKQASPAAALLKKFDGAGLSDEQKAQIEKIATEYAPKLAELKKNTANPELAKARKEAIEKAKAEGLEGQALKDTVAKALQGVKPAEGQKGASDEAKKLHSEFNQAVLAVLTAEQKEKLNLNQPKGKKPAGEKKPAAKKPEGKKPAAEKNAENKAPEKKQEEKKAEN